jgi:hypothetical protein
MASGVEVSLRDSSSSELVFIEQTPQTRAAADEFAIRLSLPQYSRGEPAALRAALKRTCKGGEFEPHALEHEA